MRSAAISVIISMALSGAAVAQNAPQPNRQARGYAAKSAPAKPAPAKPRGIIAVSQSPLPSYDSGTYQRIQAAMLSYSALQVRGGWPMLPAKAPLEPGISGPDVALLRQRLVLVDDLAANKAD